MRRSGLLLERISRLRKEFVERNSSIHEVVNPLREAPRWEEVGPVASLGQILKSFRPVDEDISGGSPSFLTLGMRQLVDRTHQLVKRIDAMDARVVDRDGATLLSLREALGEIVRNMSSLPDSALGQDSRARGLRVLIEFLEPSVQNLEAIHAKREPVLKCWDDLVLLLRKLAAWSRGSACDQRPSSGLLTPIIQCLIDVSVRPDWVDFFWMAEVSPSDPVAAIAAEGWNVGLIMLGGVRGLELFNQISREELATAALLHDIGLLLGNNEPQSSVGEGYFEAHTRRGERLIQRWLPGAGPARDVALWHHEMMNGMGYPDSIPLGDIPPFVRLAGAAKWVAGHWFRSGLNGAPISLKTALDLARGQVKTGAIDESSLMAISMAAGLNLRAVA